MFKILCILSFFHQFLMLQDFILLKVHARNGSNAPFLVRNMMEYFCFIGTNTKMVTKFTTSSLFVYSACFVNFQTIPNPS